MSCFSVEKKYFGTLSDGGEVSLYTFSNGKMKVSAMDFGCTITSILLPKNGGGFVDVVLGHSTLEGYIIGSGSHGAVIGRFANRIKGGEFEIDGVKYSVDKNGRGNCLHGGFTRLEKTLWESESFENPEKGECGVIFSHTSIENEQGFPGNLKIKVIYSLNEKNEFKIRYEATTDKATPVNFTNHAYFNLAGRGSVLEHTLKLNSDKYLETDETNVPTGKLLDVAGTPFDFTKPKKVGQDIEKLEIGYDHCFVTPNYEKGRRELCEFAVLEDEKSGRKMTMYTNDYGVQIYTAYYLEGKTGKLGTVYHSNDAICLESENFPDAVNKPNFPSCVLRPGEKYEVETIYAFAY